MGKNILYDPNCNCETAPYYILFTTSEIGTSSPLICGKCGNETPLYKIPYLLNNKVLIRAVYVFVIVFFSNAF